MDSLKIAKSKIDRLSNDPIVKASQEAAVCSKLDNAMAEIVDIRYWLANARKSARTIYAEQISIPDYNFEEIVTQLTSLYGRLLDICTRMQSALEANKCFEYTLANYGEFLKVNEELRQESHSFDVGEVIENTFQGNTFDDEFFGSFAAK